MNESSENIAFNLSVGELAFALGVQQSEDVAFEIVQKQFNLLDDDEAEIVIISSGHSLLARDFVREDSEGNYKLSPTLDKIIRSLAEANLTILCGYTVNEEDTNLTFHFSPRGIIKHIIRNDIVHELEFIPNLDSVTNYAADFFSIPKHNNHRVQSINLGQPVFDEILLNTDHTFIENRLRQEKVPENICIELSKDLITKKLKGSVVCVERQKDEPTKVEHQMFFLAGVSRLWLLKPYESGAEWFFDISLASRSDFEKKIQSVVNITMKKTLR